MSEENRKKRIILIGRSTAGKTTLCQRINNEQLVYRKTQTVQVFSKSMIDTPGEYLEQRFFRGSLMVTAVDADIIVLLQDATEGGTMFPPGYNSMFGKPTIGVVSKCDIADEGQIERSEKYLKMAGATKVFRISSVTGEGIREFLDYLGYDDEQEKTE